jgi:probable H4MPT-linked C1 transfer pathway protein
MGVTMTAELSDLFRTKREGVNHILNCLTRVFSKIKIFVVDVDADLRSVDAAKTDPLKVAAANWAATGWMISQLLPDCIVVDVGSTTTSIIPVIGGRLAAAGKTDFEKLVNGELVYTGALRTNLAAIANSVPLRGRVARVSSELFAQSGDIHLILGNIQAKEYTAETTDGSGKTRSDAMVRLARIVCADTEMLTEQEIVEIAAYVCERQIKQIAEGLSQVYSRLKPDGKLLGPVVVAGMGKNFLAKKAAEKLGINNILDLDELVFNGTSRMAPSVGVALMAATKAKGGKNRWKP